MAELEIEEIDTESELAKEEVISAEKVNIEEVDIEELAIGEGIAMEELNISEPPHLNRSLDRDPSINGYDHQSGHLPHPP